MPDKTKKDCTPAPAQAALLRLAYRIEDAALALGLSRSRLYELIAAGEITACKLGKRTIIPASELTGLLDRHRVARLSPQRAPSPAPSKTTAVAE